MIRPRLVLAALSAWFVACGRSEEPPSPAVQTAAPERPGTPEAPPRLVPYVVPQRAPVQAAPAASEVTARTAARAREEEVPSAPPRDVGAELVALIQEQRCLNPGLARFEPEQEMHVEVTALVHPDGTIEQPVVSATGQPLPLLRCAEIRLGRTSLRAPVPGAPAAFKGSIVLAAPAAPEEQPSKPYKPPENLASPNDDYTLKGPSPLNYASRTSDDSLNGARADTIAGPPD